MPGCQLEAADEGKLRLFIAVEVPGSVDAVVGAVVAPWRTRFPSARWVPSPERHVTMRFIGATDRDRLDAVRRRVGDAARRTRSFEMALDGLGAFPSLDRARVLWLGLRGDGPNLAGLVDALALVPTASPARRPRRPFVPHLTVARSRRPVRLPAGFAATRVPDTSFSVSEIVLFRSHRNRPAGRYEPIDRYPLSS